MSSEQRKDIPMKLNRKELESALATVLPALDRKAVERIYRVTITARPVRARARKGERR